MREKVRLLLVVARASGRRTPIADYSRIGTGEAQA